MPDPPLPELVTSPIPPPAPPCPPWAPVLALVVAVAPLPVVSPPLDPQPTISESEVGANAITRQSAVLVIVLRYRLDQRYRNSVFRER